MGVWTRKIYQTQFLAKKISDGRTSQSGNAQSGNVKFAFQVKFDFEFFHVSVSHIILRNNSSKMETTHIQRAQDIVNNALQTAFEEIRTELPENISLV